MSLQPSQTPRNVSPFRNGVVDILVVVIQLFLVALELLEFRDGPEQLTANLNLKIKSTLRPLTRTRR